MFRKFPEHDPERPNLLTEASFQRWPLECLDIAPLGFIALLEFVDRLLQAFLSSAWESQELIASVPRELNAPSPQGLKSAETQQQ